MSDLRQFTLDQLLSEIARRHKITRDLRSEIQWCDDCKHFRPCKTEVVPVRFNPCLFRHEVKFLPPESVSDDFGYYRRVCADREAA